MSSDEVAQLTLLLTAANVMVNLEILDVSKQLLDINKKHLEVLLQIKEKDGAGHL